MNKFLKKLFGIDKIEAEVVAAVRTKIEAEAAAVAATEAARVVILSPKEIATEKKEPWVAVLETHIGKDNVRNGFFELDWNEYFVLQLRTAGYIGVDDEDIVDQWFTELCRNVGGEEGVDMDRRMSGSVRRSLGDGRTEVS